MLTDKDVKTMEASVDEIEIDAEFDRRWTKAQIGPLKEHAKTLACLFKHHKSMRDDAKMKSVYAELEHARAGIRVLEEHLAELDKVNKADQPAE